MWAQQPHFHVAVEAMQKEMPGLVNRTITCRLPYKKIGIMMLLLLQRNRTLMRQHMEQIRKVVELLDNWTVLLNHISVHTLAYK